MDNHPLDTMLSKTAARAAKKGIDQAVNKLLDMSSLPPPVSNGADLHYKVEEHPSPSG